MWFLRAIEQDDGRWACRHGSHQFDTHGELRAAIIHLRELAKEFDPSTLFVHRLDGTIESLPAV